MYKIKRFGLSVRIKPSEYNIHDPIPPGTERENTQGMGMRNLKWKGVDKYNIIEDSNKTKFKTHRGLLGEWSNHSLSARLINKRVTRLLKDMKGKSDNTQYVTIDNPNTKEPDETHIIGKAMNMRNPEYLAYTKDVNGEFRLSYKIEKPHKEGNKDVSDVVIDDVNDHEFGGNKYTKSGDNFSSYFNGRFKKGT